MSSLDNSTLKTLLHHDEREEGVLKDVLEELDRERSRRAELEEQVRKFQEEKDAHQASKRAQRAQAQNSAAVEVSHRVFVSMEAQVKGFQELVDALTIGKPAIAAAAAEENAESLSKWTRRRLGQIDSKVNKKTLPLHVVRLLEVLPWDPRAKQHIFAVEEIFEWQVYQDNAWRSQLRFFPTMFKTLPFVKATASQTSRLDESLADQEFESNRGSSLNEKKDRSFFFFIGGGEMHPPARTRNLGKNRILTNERVTALYDLDAGYPLPSNDTSVWEWVGGWRVGSRAEVGSTTEDWDKHKKVDCDHNGWSYVLEPQDFLLGLTDIVWDNPGACDTLTLTSSRNEDAAATPTRPCRRKRWVRQRVLVDYLYASESTQQYLKLLAENARLSITAGKISDQLVETKLALTVTEEKLVEANDLIRCKDATLQAAGILEKNIDSILAKCREDDLGVESMRSILSSDSKIHDTRDFGSKFSQWVQLARKTSEDTAIPDENIKKAPFVETIDIAHDGSSQEPPMLLTDKFDWKKIGRGNLLNKLKPNVSSSSRTGSSALKTSNNGKKCIKSASESID